MPTAARSSGRGVATVRPTRRRSLRISKALARSSRCPGQPDWRERCHRRAPLEAAVSVPYTQNNITPIVYEPDPDRVWVGAAGDRSGRSSERMADGTSRTCGRTRRCRWRWPMRSLLATRCSGCRLRNSGQFFALDAKTGKTLWTSAARQGTNAAIVRAGDVLFLLKDDAQLIVARANPARFEPLQTYSVADSCHVGPAYRFRRPSATSRTSRGSPCGP